VTDVTGKRGVALVTGAGNTTGIGFAVAAALAAQGFDVALASLENPGPSLDCLDAFGRQARYYPFDLADTAAHDAVLDRIECELAPLTCLVNNAGVSSLVRGDLLELTAESFDRSVAINLRGTFFLTQAVARRMLAAPSQSFRSIVTISSANADIVGERRPMSATNLLSGAAACRCGAGVRPMMSARWSPRSPAAGCPI
jgi:NAD(P)-dependent dehydrogenase (short-subunit alcohol dehydrogenase family)